MRQSISDKIKFYGIDEELKEISKETNKRLPSELETKYKWICRNLSVYRNCFINSNTLNKINLETLKRILKVEEINVHESENIDASMSYGTIGYILSI